MRPGFHLRLINGPFDDPGLLVRPAHEKYSMLFDAGDLGRMSHSAIFRISDVFITHMHMDHFVGFDSILRVILRREHPLNIYGPPGLAACVAGKLKGYTWNLIREYPAVINVFCFNGKEVTRTVFRAEEGFKRRLLGRVPSDGVLMNNGMFRVRAIKLSHGIPCLAYAIEEDIRINIDKDGLKRKGLSAGPWLNDFKKLLRAGKTGHTVSADGTKMRVDEIRDLAIVSKGQKISYATDLAMTGRNISRLIEFIRGSDLFCGEAYLLEKDRRQADNRFHLTAAACGSIAREAGVRDLMLMHFSPKYRENPGLIIKEAMSAFQGSRSYAAARQSARQKQSS